MSKDDEILATANIKLKPCPFCGGEVQMSTHSYGSGNYGSGVDLIVYCKHCKIEMTGGDVSWRSLFRCQKEIDELVEKWNARA